MEKDYFLDRSVNVCKRENFNIGDRAFICLKEAQVYAKELNDLNLIEIRRIMTPIEFHPRGVKVMGYEMVYTDIEEELKERYGRVVYKLNSPFTVETKEGTKAIVQSKGKMLLVNPISLKDYYSILVWVGNGSFSFSFPYHDFMYFKDDKRAKELIRDIKITDIYLDREGVVFCDNGINKKNYNVNTFCNKEPLNDSSAFLMLRNKLQEEGIANGYETAIPLKLIGFTLQQRWKNV